MRDAKSSFAKGDYVEGKFCIDCGCVALKIFGQIKRLLNERILLG